MSKKGWRKTENEAGYPLYLDDKTGHKSFDHPQFLVVMQMLDDYSNMKYSVYRTAFKLYVIQQQIKVPPLRITSGVFSRHQLSLSENSLSLELDELESVLADIYFAAEKEGLFNGDVDMTVDLIINLLLNIFDGARKEPIKVLSAKTLLIVLSEESCADKWLALTNCTADHNGCVSPRRLANLLKQLSAISIYLGEEDGDLQADVDSCFSKSSGMLGLSASVVAEWALNVSSSVRWLNVLSRIRICRTQSNVNIMCAACGNPLVQVLKFKCTKCTNMYLCEKCHLFDCDLSSIEGHKRSHTVLEIIDGQICPNERLGFIAEMRRLFICTRRRKRKTKCKKNDKGNGDQEKENKPTIFTSTVGRAHGKTANHPSNVLQDIIAQLESQNKALQDLSEQLKVDKTDDQLKLKVDTHWNQISTQINRLKALKDNLSPMDQQKLQSITDQKDRIQAFDLFSPILQLEEEKQSKVDQKTQPRVLSLDSGNFSVSSKNGQNLLTMSGDALKPVVNGTSDSISTVSMNDISCWHNESESKTRSNQTKDYSQSICVTERRFEDDLRSVASSNVKIKELNADLDTVLDRLQQILTSNFTMDESSFDNSQLRETANEMEGLLGTLIRGVEQRATLNATKSLV